MVLGWELRQKLMLPGQTGCSALTHSHYKAFLGSRHHSLMRLRIFQFSQITYFLFRIDGRRLATSTLQVWVRMK